MRVEQMKVKLSVGVRKWKKIFFLLTLRTDPDSSVFLWMRFSVSQTIPLWESGSWYFLLLCVEASEILMDANVYSLFITNRRWCTQWVRLQTHCYWAQCISLTLECLISCQWPKLLGVFCTHKASLHHLAQLTSHSARGGVRERTREQQSNGERHHSTAG